MATEKRLIDANALKSFVCEFCNSINSDEPCEPADCRCMVLIDEQPTVDAVEVVRCKDCKHYKPRNQSVHWEQTTPCCTRSACLKFPPDGFCFYGERKDNG